MWLNIDSVPFSLHVACEQASLRVDDALGSLFDPYNYNKSNYSCIMFPHDILEDRWIAVVISGYLLLCYCINLIKRFHLVVCLFSKRSQMMSKWGNENSVIYYWTVAQHHGIYICLIYQRVCFVPSGSSLWLVFVLVHWVFVFKTLS